MALRLFKNKSIGQSGPKSETKTKTRAVKTVNCIRVLPPRPITRAQYLWPWWCKQRVDSSHKLVSTDNTACVHSSACIHCPHRCSTKLKVNKTTQLVTALTVKPAGLSAHAVGDQLLKVVLSSPHVTLTLSMKNKRCQCGSVVNCFPSIHNALGLSLSIGGGNGVLNK